MKYYRVSLHSGPADAKHNTPDLNALDQNSVTRDFNPLSKCIFVNYRIGYLIAMMLFLFIGAIKRASGVVFDADMVRTSQHNPTPIAKITLQ